MTTPILNITQKICTLCDKEYQKKEISDVAKVVELACHHFYHIGCLSQALRDQEGRQTELSCHYCTQVFAPPARAVNAFTDPEIFQARLKEIKEDYDYDSKVIEAISIIDSLYTPLHDLSFLIESNDAIAENKEKLMNAIYDLVIKNEAIKEDLKGVVLRVLGAMLIGDRALRTVEGEARRWESTPFEKWPDKIKQQGVLVGYKEEGVRIRVSADHLKKVVDKIYEDAARNFLQPIHAWLHGIPDTAAVVVLAKNI